MRSVAPLLVCLLVSCGDDPAPRPDAAAPDAAPEPPLCLARDLSCASPDDCAGATCLPATEESFAFPLVDGGGTREITFADAPGGRCVDLPPVPLSGDRCPLPCGPCTRCVAEPGRDLASCREVCDPAATPRGGCRAGYRCDPFTRTCLEGCRADDECRIVAESTGALAVDPSLPIRCEDGTCAHDPGPGGLGDACDTDAECGADLECVGPVRAEQPRRSAGCSALGCARFVRGTCARPCEPGSDPCPDGAQCLLLSAEADEEPVGMCAPRCVVGGGTGVVGCAPGYRCRWDGVSVDAEGRGVGGCIPEVRAGPRPPGAPCEDDAECARVGGDPRCYPGASGSACVAEGCAAPGTPEDACGMARCVRGLPEFPRGACLSPCEESLQCSSGWACVGDETDASCAPRCQRSRDCVAGRACRDGRCEPSGCRSPIDVRAESVGVDGVFTPVRVGPGADDLPVCGSGEPAPTTVLRYVPATSGTLSIRWYDRSRVSELAVWTANACGAAATACAAATEEELRLRVSAGRPVLVFVAQVGVDVSADSLVVFDLSVTAALGPGEPCDPEDAELRCAEDLSCLLVAGGDRACQWDTECGVGVPVIDLRAAGVRAGETYRLALETADGSDALALSCGLPAREIVVRYRADDDELVRFETDSALLSARASCASADDDGCGRAVAVSLEAGDERYVVVEGLEAPDELRATRVALLEEGEPCVPDDPDAQCRFRTICAERPGRDAGTPDGGGAADGGADPDAGASSTHVCSATAEQGCGPGIAVIDVGELPRSRERVVPLAPVPAPTGSACGVDADDATVRVRFSVPYTAEVRARINDPEATLAMRTDCDDTGSEVGCRVEDLRYGDTPPLPAGSTAFVTVSLTDLATRDLVLLPRQVTLIGDACASEGPAVPCQFGAVCRAGVCVAATCGDGVPEGSEECDDGDLDETDACLSDCHLRPQGPGGPSCAEAQRVELADTPTGQAVLLRAEPTTGASFTDLACAPRRRPDRVFGFEVATPGPLRVEFLAGRAGAAVEGRRLEICEMGLPDDPCARSDMRVVDIPIFAGEAVAIVEPLDLPAEVRIEVFHE